MPFTYHEASVVTETGDRVAYRNYPDNGSAIVLLHGAGHNLAVWNPLAELLADKYHLVSIDLRGHGSSTAQGGFSIAADLAAVETVVSELGLTCPAIVGHSYGGALAVRYAASHPDCPCVMNLDYRGGQGRSEHYFGKTPSEVEQFFTPQASAAMATLSLVDVGSLAWVDTEIDRLLAKEPGVPRELALPLATRGFQPIGDDAWSRRPDRSFFVPMLEEIFRMDSFSPYEAARCPVILVLARRDLGLEEPSGEFMSAYLAGLARAFPSLGDALPDRKVVVLESGHTIPLEVPKALADLIEQLVP